MSNDLIRRNEVLSALEKLFTYYNISFGGSSGGFATAVPKVIMDIPVAYDVDRRIMDWIPIEGENTVLPDIGDDVLITTKSGHVMVGTRWGKRWSTAYRHSEEVIAWMPKPRGYYNRDLGYGPERR